MHCEALSLGMSHFCAVNGSLQTNVMLIILRITMDANNECNDKLHHYIYFKDNITRIELIIKFNYNLLIYYEMDSTVLYTKIS